MTKRRMSIDLEPMPLAVVSAADSCEEDVDGAASAEMRKRLKREHGTDDPDGTETVAAPATVSGKRIHTMSLATSREDVDAPRPASQETCHRTDQPQRTGCSDGKELASKRRSSVVLPFRHLLPSVPRREKMAETNSRQHKITVSTDCRFTGGPCMPGAELIRRLNRSIAALGFGREERRAAEGRRNHTSVRTWVSLGRDSSH